MNIVILTGRLVKDVELSTSEKKEGKNEVKYVKNTLAVKRDYKNANGEYDSDFINFVVYGPSAEFLAKHATKGTFVELNGSLQISEYLDKDENKKYNYQVIVDSLVIPPVAKKEGSDKEKIVEEK